MGMTPLSHGPTKRKTVWGAKPESVRPKATWGVKRLLVAAVALAGIFAVAADASAGPKGGNRRYPKLDWKLETKAQRGSSLNRTNVIVTLDHGDLPPDLRNYRRFDRFNNINGYVLDLPDSELGRLADLPEVVHVHPDADVHGLDFRTAVTSGSFFVNHDNGLTGAGVTVAVLDSGIAANHDDLPAASVVGFMDFVNGRKTRYDDYGHGTHVAGIIAGKGTDAGGQMAGMAPGAKLFVIKVLDSQGNGKVSNVIAALNWLRDNAAAYGVRVVNMSFGTAPDADPSLDPLALAAQALVQKGIVVVVAAGNNGHSPDGKQIWGGIGSPADSPWVITVGASSSMGTLTRKDDTMASFSSRGPAVGGIAKPDLVASGVGIVAPISSTGTMVTNLAQFLVQPTCSLGLLCPATAAVPYMSLSGTSMAAPAVSGTIALMLQANPNLTPNMVKAILQYTAEFRKGYSPLEQGAGFLNALGAVRLAKYYYTAQPGTPVPSSKKWSKAIYWGNHRLTGGVPRPGYNAWKPTTQWGALRGAAGNRVVWGTAAWDDNIIWGTSLADDNIVWGTNFSDDNIVWGTACGNADCGDNIVWGTDFAQDNIVWGTSDGNDNIVWGTDFLSDNIIWGTSDSSDNIVWGTSTDDNIVWGTDALDNIVWGTNALGDNIVWGTDDLLDNIIWGTSYSDNIVWGTNDGDNIIWGTSTSYFYWVPSKPSYTWFLNNRNDVLWIANEFGDGYTVRYGR
jgi:serine protease AprX